MTWNNTSTFSAIMISALSGAIIFLLLTIATCSYIYNSFATGGNPTNDHFIYIIMAIAVFFISIILVKLIHDNQSTEEEE